VPLSAPEVEWNAQCLINLISAAHAFLPANEIGVSRATRHEWHWGREWAFCYSYIVQSPLYVENYLISENYLIGDMNCNFLKNDNIHVEPS